ncbi:MAG: hypothetical protein AUJ04_03050 [Acidobacteria bacterium 13_1_40CM_3_55_6]|nr:MAG: hypothetical protein AUJ04_03050 [Acidobacteria bacterium 13_1_40CM_3_55_6]
MNFAVGCWGIFATRSVAARPPSVIHAAVTVASFYSRTTQSPLFSSLSSNETGLKFLFGFSKKL